MEVGESTCNGTWEAASLHLDEGKKFGRSHESCQYGFVERFSFMTFL